MADDGYVELLALDRRFQQLTGREALGYVSHPTPTSTRVAFGDGSVCLSMDEARGYLARLVADAEAGKPLPYPFEQELTPGQDLRVINGWDGDPS